MNMCKVFVAIDEWFNRLQSQVVRLPINLYVSIAPLLLRLSCTKNTSKLS